MWYWFPLIHMFSLTLTPNALIGLTERLKIPKNFEFKSGAKPSLFAYPEPLQPPKKEETTKTAAAVLSTAAKAKALKEKKEKESEPKKPSVDVDMDDKVSVSNSVVEGASIRGGDAVSVAATPGTTVVGSAATESVAASDLGSEIMEVDEQHASTAGVSIPKETAPKAEEEEKAGAEAEAAKGSDAAAADKKGDVKKEAEEGKKDQEPEPSEEILRNPCRVLKAQMQYISFPQEIDGKPVRYTPLLENRRVGFLLLRDNRPEEAEDLFLEDEKADDGEKEPDPPEPFEWTDN